MRKHVSVLGFLFVAAFTRIADAQSCCLQVRRNSETEKVVNGIQDATVLLLIVPWALIGGIVLWIWRKSKSPK